MTKHATSWVVVGRGDSLEVCWCGHLHQRLVRDQWLISVVTTVTLLATAAAALALLAHLLAGYCLLWGKEQQIHHGEDTPQANFSTCCAGIFALDFDPVIF